MVLLVRPALPVLLVPALLALQVQMVPPVLQALLVLPVSQALPVLELLALPVQMVLQALRDL